MQVAVRVTSRLTQSCSRQLTTFSDYLASNFVRYGKKSIERMEVVEAVRYYREAIEGGGGESVQKFTCISSSLPNL